jgi:hypothetical protein
MPKRSILSVRIPLVVEAEAEGPLAVCLLFALVIGLIVVTTL